MLALSFRNVRGCGALVVLEKPEAGLEFSEGPCRLFNAGPSGGGRGGQGGSLLP